MILVGPFNTQCHGNTRIGEGTILPHDRLEGYAAVYWGVLRPVPWHG